MRYEDFLKHLSYNKPEEQESKETGGIGYFTQGHAWDDFAIGTGQMLEGMADMTERAMRPDNMTPSQWRDSQGALLKNFLTGTRATAENLKDREVPEFEDNSVPYHLRNIVRSAPESISTMIAAYLAGQPVGGLLGGAANAAINFAQKTPRGLSLIENLYRAYQSGNPVSKAVRTLTPSSTGVVASAEIGAALEANSEKNQAINRHIENAKRNGTYVLDKTELEAEQIGDKVFRDNMAIISAFNLPQYNMLFGNKAVRGLLPNLGRAALGAGSEGAEEMAQELASAYELGEPVTWQALRDAGIAGAGMGGAMHISGRATEYVGNREWNLPSEKELKERENQRKERFKETSRNVGKTYSSFRGAVQEALADDEQYRNDTARQAYRDASTENLTAKQVEIWDAAQYASARAKEKFGYDIPPELIYKQWAHEAGVNFDSPNARYNNNFGGLTQSEPNGEDNKQPDGNNYYRHFNNVREYADAYVDDFIKYYPEMSGVKSEREFANVLKSYGYFGDTVENYASSMEGIAAPTSSSSVQNRGGNIFGVANYNMPTQSSRIDEQVSSLKDGWQSVIPQIGGVLREKFGINAEISSAARTAEHNAEVGGVPTSHHIIRENGGDALDIVFDRDTTQEEQDRIADYFKSTGLFSEVLYHDVGSGAHLHLGGLNTENLNSVQNRADQLFNERYDPNKHATPQWQQYQNRPQQKEQPKQEEPQNPLFDINAEDEQTQKLFEKFAKEQYTTAVEDGDADTVQFFFDKFDQQDNFQNTEQNREALRNRYGDELTNWAMAQAQPAEQTQVKQDKPKPKQSEQKQESPYLADQSLTDAINKLREKAVQEKNTPLLTRINAARNNPDELRNILKQNGIEVSNTQQSQPQPEQQKTPDPVTENKPPENVLPRSKAEEKRIKVASAPVAEGKGETKRNKRKKQGNALISLAAQNNIQIPSAELIALQNGSTKKVKEWQEKLRQSGAFNTTPKQEPPQQQSPQQSGIVERQDDNGTTKFTPAAQIPPEPSDLYKRAQDILQSAQEPEEEFDDSEPIPSVNPEDLNDVMTEEEEQQSAEAQRKRDSEFRQRETEKAWKAKQEKELQELEARKAEAKSLAAEGEKNARQYRLEQKDAIELENQIADEDTEQKIQNAEFEADLEVAREKKAVQPRDKTRKPQIAETVLQAPEPISPKFTEQSQQTPQEEAAVKKQEAETAEQAEQEPEKPSTKADQLFQDWYGRQKKSKDGGLIGDKPRKKAERAKEILDRMNKGEISEEVAEKQMDEFLRTGKLPKDTSKTETPKPNKKSERQERKAKLHDKLQTDSHPNLKKYLEKLLKTAAQRTASPERTDAIDELKDIEGTNYTDEDLSNWESDLESEKVGHEPPAFKEQEKFDLKPIKTSDSKGGIAREIKEFYKDDNMTFDANGRIFNNDTWEQEDAHVFKQGDKYVFGRFVPKKAQPKQAPPKVEPKPESTPKQEPEQKTQPKPREYTGKWKSFGWAETRRKLVNQINNDLGVREAGDGTREKSGVTIKDDGTIQSKTGKFLGVIRKADRGFEYGRYDTPDGKPLPEEEPAFTPYQEEPAFTPVKQEKPPTFSREGDVDTTIDNFVDDDDLTPQQKLLKSFGKKLGVRVVFFSNSDGRFHGAHKNGITYLNVNSNMPLGKVFWHESMHWLKNSNPELYRALAKAAGITDKQRQAYLEKSRRKDLTSDEAIDEEILADAMQDVAKRTGLLQSIAGKNRGLIERVIQWLKDTMNKFVDHFRNPQGRLTTAQAKALAAEFGKIAKQLTDPNGDKIFRYNRRTGNIELADGRALSSIESEHSEKRGVFDLEPQFSFAGKKAKTANLETLKQAKKMEERGADKARIYELTGWFKGRDGKWRFEIPDNREQMHLEKLTGREGFSKYFPLSDVYDNPALFEAYPKLKTISVIAVDPQGDRPESKILDDAEAVTIGKKIIFNVDMLDIDPDEAQKTLVHEIQHVIQNYEKFSSGGSFANVEELLRNNADKILYTVGKIENGKEYFDSILAVRKARLRGNERAEAKARKEMTQAKQALKPKDREKIETLASRYDEIKNTKLKSNRAREDAYWRLGGEQEARQVEERLDNHERIPVSHDADALIVFGGKTYPIDKKNAARNGNGELVKGSILRSAATADGTTTKAVTKATAGTDNKGGVSPNANVETNSPKRNIPYTERDNKPKYSIGNDNSSESLSQKIRNKLSAWFGDGNAPRTRRNKRITETIQKITGHRILFNSVEDADGTIVDDFNKVIKTPHAYEWETLLPQIGGKFAQSLGLNPTEKMNNYIADWLLTGALNNTSAEATDFKAAMRDNPAMAELFQLIRKDFQEVADLPAIERIGETIQHKEGKSLSEHLKDFGRGFKEQFTDDLHPVYRMLEDMKKTVPPDTAKLIDESINVYKKARLLKGKGAIADMMIDGVGEDIEKIRKSLQDQYPDMYFDKFKSIRMILDDAGILDKKLDLEAMKKRLRDFESYCVAKLDKEIHEKNRAGKTDVKPQFKESDDDEVIAQYEKQFGQAQRDLVTFSNILLTMQFKAGLISLKQYSNIVKSWENYVPMARVFDENEEYDFANSFKPKVGSKRDTWSPVAKILFNTQEMIAQAERNKVKLELADFIRCGGYGEFAAEVEKGSKDKGNIVTFKENGELKRLNVYDIAVARAIDSIQGREESTWIMKALRASSRFLRAMYTLVNPDYAAGNIFRDMADAFIHNKNLSKNPITALMEVWRAAMTEVLSREKTQDYYDWLASGGSQSGFVTEGLDYAQREIDELLGGAGRTPMGKTKYYFTKVIHGIEKLAEVSEYATRRTTYKSNLNKLAAASADGKATVQDKANAALESRDASIDFAKSGRSMRQINRVVLFSNAAVQSWALWGKAFKDAKNSTEGRKALAGKVFRAVAQGVLFSVLQALVNYSDDDRRKEYKNANDWEKDTYWIFGGFKIPKGVDVGIRLMSALTEEFINNRMTDDPIEWRRIGKAFKDSLPSLTATIFTPMIETSLNSSWFREAPIVPYVEQKLPARLQYGSENTSIAKFIGEKLDYSPRKVDYLINGYLGFMGRFFSRVPDYLSGRRALSLDEAPMVRRFIFSPYKNPKIVKDYYEAYDRQEELYNGYKLERSKGEKVDLPEDYDRALHKRLKAALEPMRKISKQEKKFLEDSTLDSDQRKEKLQELEKKRIALCEKVFKRAQ